MSKWTLFSNHGHVLVVLSRDPDARLRDVAQIVGITERAVQKIVRDLQDGGLVSVTKHGRRNRYRIHPNQPMRHTLEAHCTTGELLEMINRHAPGQVEADEARITIPAPATAAATIPPPETPVTGSTHEVPAAESQAEHEVADAPARPPKPVHKPLEPPDDGDQGSLF